MTVAEASIPAAGPTYLNGKLLGVTGSCVAYNAGTIFELGADGTERVVHSFGSGTDGAHPASALIVVGDTLYGTTQDGGIWDAGTVFSFTPDAG